MRTGFEIREGSIILAERRALRDYEDARRTFFRDSLAIHGQAVWLRAYARELCVPEALAAPMLEALAAERGWLALRSREGVVIGIAPSKAREAVAA